MIRVVSSTTVASPRHLLSVSYHVLEPVHPDALSHHLNAVLDNIFFPPFD